MTYRDIVLGQIHHQESSRVPYTLPIEHDVAVKLDEYYRDTAWRDRIEPFIVGVSAVDTDPKTPIDDRYVRDAYGGIWRQDIRPWHLETPPLSEPDFGDYVFPEPETFFRPEWKEQARITCEKQSDSFLIGNLGWGLWERTWNLRGFENALMDSALNPDFFGEVLDRLTDLYLAFVEYTADLPVDGILFGDDWGDQRGVILGPDRWRELVKPRWARIYDAVHAHGKIVMSHSCGSVRDILPDAIEIGLDVLESCQPEPAGMNPYELKRDFGDKVTFWGGLGSQTTIPRGTPAEIRGEVARLRNAMAKGGGYILAPAKPLQPETPVENAVAILESFTEAAV